MWIVALRHHMWVASLHPAPDVLLESTSENVIPVERITKSYPQPYPQKRPLAVHSIFWIESKSSPISGGACPTVILAFNLLLHSEGYLSTKNRELSTVYISAGQLWGITLPPKYRSRFVGLQR